MKDAEALANSYLIIFWWIYSLAKNKMLFYSDSQRFIFQNELSQLLVLWSKIQVGNKYFFKIITLFSYNTLGEVNNMAFTVFFWLFTIQATTSHVLKSARRKFTGVMYFLFIVHNSLTHQHLICGAQSACRFITKWLNSP